MDVCPFAFVVCCEVSGLCDDLIIRGGVCVCVCLCMIYEPQQLGGPGPSWALGHKK